MEQLNVWTITNKILIAAGTSISLLIIAVASLVVMGFNAQNSKIDQGNASLLSHIAEIKQQHRETSKTTSDLLFGMTKDIARIDANQQDRLNRERDDRFKKRSN